MSWLIVGLCDTYTRGDISICRAEEGPRDTLRYVFFDLVPSQTWFVVLMVANLYDCLAVAPWNY